MGKLAYQVYLLELDRQSSFALYSLEKMDEAINDEVIADLPAFWFYAQSLLNACANISKLLWKSAKDEEKNLTTFKKELRKLMDLKLVSSLKDKKVRNGFEHYDENLFEWLAMNDGYSDSCVGSGEVFKPEEHLRLFRTDNTTLYFSGIAFPIKEIGAALLEIKERIVHLMNDKGIEIEV